MPDEPSCPSLYHCGSCGRATDAHGSIALSGTCPETGKEHEVDLLFHHRHAHNPSDPYGKDPDCLYCQHDD